MAQDPYVRRERECVPFYREACLDEITGTLPAGYRIKIVVLAASSPERARLCRGLGGCLGEHRVFLADELIAVFPFSPETIGYEPGEEQARLEAIGYVLGHWQANGGDQL